MTAGGTRFRYGPWKGSCSTSLVVPLAGGSVDVDAVAEVSEAIVGMGFTEVLTAALGPREQAPFLEWGYLHHEPLRLLEADLGERPPPPALRTRRMRRRDLAGVLAIDSASFTPFWQFDADSLAETGSATPVSRCRVVRREGAVLGYAVTGHAGSTGFVQRLAVDPSGRGGGIGSSLLADGLAWLRRRGAGNVLVNTQPDNERALALYGHFGFVENPDGLAVLRYTPQ